MKARTNNMKDTIIHKDENMIIYDHGYEILVEHNNHDNTCFLYRNYKDEIEGFSGTLDLHKHIIDWVNNHKLFRFGEDLEDYKY